MTTSRSRSALNTTIASSYKNKWYHRRPLVPSAYFTDLQNGSYIAGIYTLVQAVFMIGLVIFDIYCLIEAAPGSTHYRYFGINFLFVYSGNQLVRSILIIISIVSFIGAIALLVVTSIFITALRKEQENKFLPWIYTMGVWIVWRTIAIVVRSICNDLYYGYHQAMLIIWIILIGCNVFAFLVVLSNYQELTDITRLEDMARLKISTISSLNASRSVSHHSLDMLRTSQPNSRPPTLHDASFQSTMSRKSSMSTASAV